MLEIVPHLISAFLVGGTVIATLSFLAEKSSRALRGIIIAFPSTMAVSFIFLALNIELNELPRVLPGVCYSLISAILFAFVYVFIAQRFHEQTPKQIAPIVYTLITASLIWLLFVFILSFAPQELFIALTTLLVSILLLQLGYSKYANAFPVCTSSPTTGMQEFIVRVVFSGSIVATALLVAKSCGPFWGAVVGGTYPASFGSQLMIFQAKYPAKFLPSLIKTVPIGVLSSTVYAIVVTTLYPIYGILLGTILGFASSLLVSLSTGYLSGRYSND